jgi:hypothetical protein
MGIKANFPDNPACGKNTLANLLKRLTVEVIIF